MPKYRYATYNPGQYPGDVQAQLDDMSAAGWHVHTALPAYTELYILWEHDDPAPAEVRLPAARQKITAEQD